MRVSASTVAAGTPRSIVLAPEALDRAQMTLDGITSFEMANVTGTLSGGSVEYRVELRVWFTLLERMHG